MPENGHVGERLSAYLDGELEPEARATVAAHLAACATCAGELEELRRLQVHLRETQVPDPGPAYWSSFAARVQHRLTASEASSTSTWLERLSGWFVPSGALGWVRLAGAFATVTLVAYLGMRGFRPESSGRIEPLHQGRQGVVTAPRETAPAAEVPSAAQSVEKPEVPEKRVGEQEVKEQGSSERSTVPPSPVEPAKPEHVRGERATKQERDEKAVLSATPAQKGAATAAPQPEATPKASFAPEPPPAREEASKPSAPESPPPRAAPMPPPAPKSADATTSEREASKEKVQAQPVPGSMTSRAAPSSRARLASPQRNEAGATQEARLSLGAEEATELPVRDFVAAALAGDTLAARAARDRFAGAAPAEAPELVPMETWLHDVAALKLTLAFRATRPGGASLLALDTLLWPRREQAALRPQVEELGRRLVEQSDAAPELQPRAQAYAAWLAENATDAASRAEWQRRLETLR